MRLPRHPLSSRDWLGIVVVAALATVAGLMIAGSVMWITGRRRSEIWRARTSHSPLAIGLGSRPAWWPS